MLTIAVIETKIELSSHKDTCVVGNHYLVVHDHSRPVNVFGCDPKVGLKHAHTINTAVVYIKPEIDVCYHSLNQLGNLNEGS